jgi:hypothetical protein
MPTHHDMPSNWSAEARRRVAETDAAIERARLARAATAEATASGRGQAGDGAALSGAVPGGASGVPGRLDELARKRSARLAAEEARRRAMSHQPPPGPLAG